MTEFKAGDRIRSTKIFENTVRVNGALDLTLEYYGPQHVVYSWKNPTNGNSGESYETRVVFDAEYELMPEMFEVGKTYRSPVSETNYECVFANDDVGLLKKLNVKAYVTRYHACRSMWEVVQ